MRVVSSCNCAADREIKKKDLTGEGKPNIPRGTILMKDEVELRYGGPLSKKKVLEMTVTCDYVSFEGFVESDWTFILACDIYDVRQKRVASKFSFRAPGPFIQSGRLLDKYIIKPKGGRADIWVFILTSVTRSNVTKNISFAPLRPNIRVHPYVGGGAYFNDLAYYLDKATYEVLIGDWWLCPKLYLLRNPLDNFYRLDNILKRIADKGVRVRVLLYNPPLPVLALNSNGVKSYLQSLSPNIHVNVTPKGENFKYSHHQKFVVIDRCLAFLGGVDLCYGRYNEPGSKLDDIDTTTYPGKLDYGKC